MVIADAVLFVRKQISRARGSIQIVAIFIWEFYKWLYVIAQIRRSLRHRYNCFPDRAAIGAEILLLLFTMKLKNPRVRCWWQNELV